MFTAALLVIRAQPYDDHDLRELLLPDGCPAPCFMGIRPGVTTAEEAMAILEASGWASDIQSTNGTRTTDGQKFITVNWVWNGKQSPLINRLYRGYIISYEQNVRSFVDVVHVSTVVTNGSIDLFLQPLIAYDIDTGMPDWRGKIPFGITMIYDHVEVSAHLECPLNIRGIWAYRATINFYSSQPNANGYAKIWDNRQIIRMLQSICGS